MSERVWVRIKAKVTIRVVLGYSMKAYIPVRFV